MTVHEIGQVDSTHYIAIEFIEGVTLRERITRGPIPPDEALEIATQVASALCVAHRAGIVHRDIKPENIMIRPDGYVKVLDFGIAKSSATETAVSAATSAVLAHEHAHAARSRFSARSVTCRPSRRAAKPSTREATSGASALCSMKC